MWGQKFPILGISLRSTSEGSDKRKKAIIAGARPAFTTQNGWEAKSQTGGEADPEKTLIGVGTLSAFKQTNAGIRSPPHKKMIRSRTD